MNWMPIVPRTAKLDALARKGDAVRVSMSQAETCDAPTWTWRRSLQRAQVAGALLAAVLGMLSVDASAQGPAEAPRGTTNSASSSDGPPFAYFFVAGGRTEYDFDCFFWTYCEEARGNAVKFGVGYRISNFGLELWAADLGRGQFRGPSTSNTDAVRLRLGGASVHWALQFAPGLEGLLRVGGAQVRHDRDSSRASTAIEPTFGLALNFSINRHLAVEVAWDVARADGRDTGSTLASVVTGGLRIRF